MEATQKISLKLKKRDLTMFCELTSGDGETWTWTTSNSSNMISVTKQLDRKEMLERLKWTQANYPEAEIQYQNCQLSIF